MKKIAVYCASSDGGSPIYKKAAYALGQSIALSNIELVYGGAKVGLMGAVADGALSKGGIVIGVIPHFLSAKELQHNTLTETIVVDTMHQRKAKMAELADGFMALPGGFGTMEELFEMMTWAQLALHSKPIGLLNINNFYTPLIKFIDEMAEQKFIKKEHRDLLLVENKPELLIKGMEKFVPLVNDKWFETVKCD